MITSRIIGKNEVEALMAEHKGLGEFGINPSRMPGERTTDAAYMDRAADSKNHLLSDSGMQQVTICYAFAQRFNKRETMNHCCTSYGMKHWVEESFDGVYVSNGAFISAMLLLGFKIEEDIRGSPNCFFNFSSKWEPQPATFIPGLNCVFLEGGINKGNHWHSQRFDLNTLTTQELLVRIHELLEPPHAVDPVVIRPLLRCIDYNSTLIGSKQS